VPAYVAKCDGLENWGEWIRTFAIITAPNGCGQRGCVLSPCVLMAKAHKKDRPMVMSPSSIKEAAKLPEGAGIGARWLLGLILLQYQGR